MSHVKEDVDLVVLRVGHLHPVGVAQLILPVDAKLPDVCAYVQAVENRSFANGMQLGRVFRYLRLCLGRLGERDLLCYRRAEAMIGKDLSSAF